ncbi:MAG TPA: tetraacyldisaccharide 4'-kinase [Acidobacteriota bacterium]|nr:tetraacyldisaccharide 4'-kinase [Acidobacteriota bacterium]
MLYSLLYTLAMLLAAPFLLLSGRTRKKYLLTAAARLGSGSVKLNPERKPAIWLHAVSVGEALAAKPLVAELKRKLPDFLIFVSTTTSTGREVAEKSLDADGFFYFPFDWKFAVRRALRSTGAHLCIVLETELWPNFIRTLSRRKIPLVLANGRISDRSFRRYRRFRWFFRPLLHRFSVLCAQSVADAERLEAIGAHTAGVIVSGNLKFERGQFAIDAADVEHLRVLLAIDPGDGIVIAGSTHGGEEEAVLEAFEKIKSEHGGLRLVIVPRRPERFGEVAELLAQKGADFVRYSELENGSRRAEVILIDTIGLLRPLYHLATAAFIGGSLIPHGGQNPLEACAAGVPVVFGPHMSNFREIARQVLDRKAGKQVANRHELTEALSEIFADEHKRAAMAEAALAVIEENQEALPLTTQAVRSALARRGLLTGAPLILKILAKIHHTALGLLRKEPRARLASAPRLNAATVSVGGLSFGGSGKSPMVATLAERFQRAGKKVAVLTRGYKGSGSEPLVVSDGKKILAGAGEAGDEPVMLAGALPGLIVIKDRVRIRGGRLAEERFNPDIFLLDDGFQHRAIGRDFNLLMLDADSVFGTGMPCHQLREPLRFAKAADAIVLLGRDAKHRSEAGRYLTENSIAPPLFEAQHRPTGCTDFHTDETIPMDELKRKKLLAFCGIADPERFALSLTRLEADPLDLVTFPDHHKYTEGDLNHLVELWKRNGADVMITTSKDAQRLRSLPGLPDGWPEVLVLTVRLEMNREDELIRLIEEAMKQ